MSSSLQPQAPLSMKFSRQEYWSGLHFLLQGIFPTPGIKPTYPASPALAGQFFTTSTIWEAPCVCVCIISNILYIYIIQTLKKKEILSFETHWKDFEGIMLSETNQIEKDKYCILSLIHRIWGKNKTLHINRQDWCFPKAGRWGIG